MDKGQFLADFIKCLVSFGIREISDPLFSGKVQLIVTPEVDSMDPKTIENLLFFLDRTKVTQGTNRNIELIGRIAKIIESKEWIVKGEFKDLFMLINILNKN